MTIGLLSILLLPVSLFAQGETALVKAVKAKLDKVKDYEAKGRLKMDVSFINAPASEVAVYYKKPDLFKVTKSGGISILPKGGVTVNISSLLASDQYTVVPAGQAVVKGVTTKVVKMLPLQENSDVVLSTIYIDEKSLLIRKATVTTKESGSYEMEMDYGKYSAWGLPDKMVFLFNTKDYKLPKGVTFEYEKGGETKTKNVKKDRGRIEITYAQYTINKGVPDAVFRSK